MSSTEGRFRSLVSPGILKIEPYKPGKPVEELRRERGIEKIYKLASNENPFGASAGAVKALEEVGGTLNRYPDGFGYELKSELAARWGVGMEQLVLGNGSSEIIEMMVRLFVDEGRNIVTADPSFSIYEIVATAQGGSVKRVALDEGNRVDLDAVLAAIDADTSLVILGNPNNPTGDAFTKGEWERFLGGFPKGVALLLDEAYAEYADGGDFPVGRDYVNDERPLVVVRTFSKVHGLAALRIGYAIAPAEIVDYMNRLRLPFNANKAAQVAALAALRDVAHLENSVEMNRRGRERLQKFFGRLGVEFVPSQANFVLAKVGNGDEFFEALLDEGVIVRSTSGFGLKEWIRVTVGTDEELGAFETAFENILVGKVGR